MGALAQGGFDRDRYCFKITKGEVIGVVCRAIFGGIGGAGKDVSKNRLIPDNDAIRSAEILDWRYSLNSTHQGPAG